MIPQTHAACKLLFNFSHAFFAACIARHAADTIGEVIKMSPKELLYIEDALGHTQFLMNQCRTAASQLKDPDADRVGLVVRDKEGNYQLVNGNQKLFTQFYNLV